MNALERTKIALKVAESLKHEKMASILRQKVANLEFDFGGVKPEHPLQHQANKTSLLMTV